MIIMIVKRYGPMVEITKLNFPSMMKKLNDMYDEEEQIKKDIKKLELELRQVRENKELLQLMIMHQNNKEYRQAQWSRNAKVKMTR